MNPVVDPQLEPARPGDGPPPDAAGLHATAAGEEQMYLAIVATPTREPQESARRHYADVALLLRERGLRIVHERLFGSLAVEAEVRAGRAAALREAGVSSATPITYIQGHPPWGEGFAGAQLLTVSPRSAASEVWTLRDEGRPCGRAWRTGGATFLYLHGLHGLVNGSAPGTRAEETRRMIERAERILSAAGASYGDVIRTWFYLNDILDWYAEFNAARSAKYSELGIMPDGDGSRILLPASTGIAGVAPHRSAGSLDLIAAFGSPAERPRVRQLSSPGQRDAFRYGSAFSRGAVICEAEACVLQLSGTASIDENGATAHIGDPRGQIECTLDKIETLLAQEGAHLRDICSATAFVKKPAYAALFWQIVRERGLEAFPAVCVVADVCRPDLLFEMDGEVLFHHEHPMA
ncbi:MAG: Rid family hydrolase [Planctomycetota bacterium]